MCLVFSHRIDPRSIPKDEWVSTVGESSVSFYSEWKQALLRWVTEKREIKENWETPKSGREIQREEYQNENFWFVYFVFKTGSH